MSQHREKLLTITLFARNDNYLGNFKYRLGTSLNFAARSLARLGRLDDVEILVTDWNSDRPLAEAIPLSVEAASICRFIEVPADIAVAYHALGKKVHVTCASNTAIRRAAGQFIMMSDADTIITAPTFFQLLSLLERKLPLSLDPKTTFFLGGRAHLPMKLVDQEISLDAWERFIQLNGQSLQLDRGYHGLGTHGSGQLMHRDLWQECGGYDESLPAAAWLDAELTLRVTQRYPLLNLNTFGIVIFHLEHQVVNLHSSNIYRVNRHFKANDDHWGLSDLPLQIKVGSFVLEDAPPDRQHWTIHPKRPTAPKGIGYDPNQLDAQLRADLHNDWIARNARAILSGIREYLKILRAEKDGSTLLHQQMTPEDLDRIERRIEPTAKNLSLFHAISWYSLFFTPRTYLEFGISNAVTVPFVIGVSPYVDVYGIDDWQQKNGSVSPYFMANFCEAFRHKGTARYVTGEVETGLRRLEKSLPIPTMFDLVLLRTELFSSPLEKPLTELIPVLSPGGAIIVQELDASHCDKLLAMIASTYPHIIRIRFLESATAILLTLPPSNNFSSDIIGPDILISDIRRLYHSSTSMNVAESMSTIS